MPDGVRHVEFEACFNFRDVGGYGTVDGRSVRWGCVFRADSLHRLQPADFEVMSALDVGTVIDLRATAELVERGRYARAEQVAFHHLPLFEQHALPFEALRPENPPPPGEIYMAIANAGAPSLATALRMIADAETAVVFHCAAGKDRTGILAALLLEILGVPDEDIVVDYQLSDRSLDPASAWARANDADWAAWLDTAPAWLLRSPEIVMHAFLAGLRREHGTIEAFLVAAGLEPVTIDTLRDRLLV